MAIKWKNIGAAALFLGGLVMYMKWHDFVHETLRCLGHISPAHNADARMFGAIVLGLLCLTIVCIVRLLNNQ